MFAIDVRIFLVIWILSEFLFFNSSICYLNLQWNFTCFLRKFHKTGKGDMR